MAAAQVTVHAYVDKTTMGDSEVLLYTVEASGDFRDLGRITAPETRGLAAAQTSPVQSWDVSVAGGQTRQRLRLQWQYRPLSTGTARFGEATLRLDGQAYTTAQIEVTVVPQSQRPASALWSPRLRATPRPDLERASDLFIRAEPSSDAVWLGEQVVVDYVLYFESNVRPRNSRIASAWDADGFWREELNLDRFLGTRTVVIDGRTFEAAPIKRLALFPTRTGPLAVDSLDIEIDVLRSRRSQRSGGLFRNPFSSRFERETLTAPRVAVETRPLPPDAPASFNGAVGQFGLAVQADRSSVDVGEPVRVTATLSGTGNIATLEAPRWQAPGAFEQYPARTSERITRSAERLRGEKAFTFTIVPRSGGRFVLPPLEWSYFEPEAAAYRTLRSDSLRLQVIGPAAPRAEAAPSGTSEAFAGPLETATWQRVREAVPLWQQPWVWAGFGLPALALLGLALVRHLRDRDDDTAAARSLRAFPEAQRGLEAAAAHLDADAPRAFYAALDQTLRLFLTDRLATSARSLALPDLGALLAERGVTPESRREVLRLLRESDAAPFAPRPQAPPADTLERATRLMAAVDDEAAPVEAA
ncbi:MAG: BatD family protein [Bacteroidota bacterium]